MASFPGPQMTTAASMSPISRAMRTRLVRAALAAMITGSRAAPVAVGAGSHPPPAAGAAQAVDQFEKNVGVFPGYRRNHAKGVCITGFFVGSGRAARYSSARVFARGERTPVTGRLSIPGTNPHAWDASTPIRGMALRFTQSDGQEWRTAMNAVAAFPVATPALNGAFLALQQPDPASGNPDPARLAAFFAAHPAADAFRRWAETVVPSTSYATVTYNSVDTFQLVDARGVHRPVRWSTEPLAASAAGGTAPEGPDDLAADLRHRLAEGPLRWRLWLVLAGPADPVLDASRAWPADRPRIDAGTLIIVAAEDQAQGPCRDVNYDPLTLPAGIEASADPLLIYRSEVYKESHRRRLAERRDARRAGATRP